MDHPLTVPSLESGSGEAANRRPGQRTGPWARHSCGRATWTRFDWRNGGRWIASLTVVRLLMELVELAVRAMVFVAEMVAIAVVGAYRFLVELIHGFRAEGNPKASEDTSKVFAAAILAALIGLLIVLGSLLSGGGGNQPTVDADRATDVRRPAPTAPLAAEEAVYRDAKQAADTGSYAEARQIIDDGELTGDGPDRVARRLARHVRTKANRYVRTFSHGRRARQLAQGANTIYPTQQGRRLLAEVRQIPIAPRAAAPVAPAEPSVPSAPSPSPDLDGGPTGVCNDGTVSDSVGRPGACSGHGGVAG